ncbi:hypothetical protein ACFL41_00930 [Gemmatimonadota bacterium]
MHIFKPRDRILLPIACLLAGTMLVFQGTIRSAVDSVWDFMGQVFTAAPSYDSWRQSGPTVGEEAPEIIGTSLSGDTIRLSDYRGSIVFLNFWADT